MFDDWFSQSFINFHCTLMEHFNFNHRFITKISFGRNHVLWRWHFWMKSHKYVIVSFLLLSLLYGTSYPFERSLITESLIRTLKSSKKIGKMAEIDQSNWRKPMKRYDWNPSSFNSNSRKSPFTSWLVMKMASSELWNGLDSVN